MTVAIITACYGNFDVIRPQHKQSIATDWYCVTDTDCGIPDPWQPIVTRPRCDDPRMAAKWPKMQPARVVAGYDDMIWVDANMEVKSPHFAAQALIARQDGLAASTHPRRDCIYAEAQASVGAESQGGKYDGQPILEQVAAYRDEGHPAHYGLWACGVVAWDLRNPRAQAFGAAWLAECERWSVQDQLSFPVVARRLAMRPGRFPIPQLESGPWFGNRHVQIHQHLR